ncbi:uncharacterized protein LOC111319754 [Stylophora pistillata]|uniref:uncharacterized protein LOC111319754 n=1 Tax=Stylophora pistillata TaxID=50429 RepID=UPI000C03F6B9|nr:uncharacterized protein LOC111319754 [Stylophora pistillata]
MGLSTAHSLKCYVCEGTEDDCSKKKLEANKDSNSQDCPSGMNECMRVWAKKDGKTAVANSCSNSLGCDAAKKVCDDAKDGECAVGCCDSDYCNAGSSVSVSVILMTVSSALGLHGKQMTDTTEGNRLLTIAQYQRNLPDIIYSLILLLRRNNCSFFRFATSSHERVRTEP